MGRAKAKDDVDFNALLDLAERGYNQKQIAETLGVSTTTISKRIAIIQQEQGVLLQYRNLQSLQLTSLQARILEAITPEKIMLASLKDLILCFKILKDKEHLIDGKPTELKGMLSLLVQLEKEDFAAGAPIPEPNTVTTFEGSVLAKKDLEEIEEEGEEGELTDEDYQALYHDQEEENIDDLSSSSDSSLPNL